MIKYIFLLIASFWGAAFAAQDAHYYSVHPVELQKALTQCSTNKSIKLSCEQLKEIAAKVNKLAYQLRLDPQEFGKQILLLQENIAKLESSLKDTSPSPELMPLLIESHRHLNERLAIVKWLESPVS